MAAWLIVGFRVYVRTLIDPPHLYLSNPARPSYILDRGTYCFFLSALRRSLVRLQLLLPLFLFITSLLLFPRWLHSLLHDRTFHKLSFWPCTHDLSGLDSTRFDHIVNHRTIKPVDSKPYPIWPLSLAPVVAPRVTSCLGVKVKEGLTAFLLVAFFISMSALTVNWRPVGFGAILSCYFTSSEDSNEKAEEVLGKSAP